MNDNDLCEALADNLASEHHQMAGRMGASPVGNLRDRLSEVFKKLRGAGVPWSKILALAGQIVAIIVSGGGNWTAIITAILALFFPPTPAPTP